MYLEGQELRDISKKELINHWLHQTPDGMHKGDYQSL
jgi:hypothetical protein